MSFLASSISDKCKSGKEIDELPMIVTTNCTFQVIGFALWIDLKGYHYINIEIIIFA